MIKGIKFGVVGVGHLGTFHVQQIQKIKNAHLVGLFDLNFNLCENAAKKYKVLAFKNIKDLFKSCDAISVVTPTPSHYKIASSAIESGCHVFVEKPITHKISDAKKLISLAELHNVKLQVGHIERFNPTYTTFCQNITKPLFIESHRLSPFNIRGSDVAVVLDLMIHDIDLVLDLVGDKIDKIDAVGASVVSSFIDLANARLTFKNGVVANLTASRVSDKQMRQMRIFEKNSYSALDFHSSTIKRFVVNKKREIKNQMIRVKKDNALFLELQSFVDSIILDTKTVVSGTEGLCALKVAIEIQKIIEKQKNK